MRMEYQFMDDCKAAEKPESAPTVLDAKNNLYRIRNKAGYKFRTLCHQIIIQPANA